MIGRIAAAAGLMCALAASASAAPAKTTSVDLGAAKLYEQSDDSAQLAGIQLFVSAGLDRQTPQQNGLAALTAECVLHSPAGGSTLQDAVAARGGSLTYNIDAQYVRFYLEAAPSALASLAALVKTVIASPDTAPPTLAAARSALRARIAEDERNPVAVGISMFRQSFYAGGAGLPPLGTSATVATLTASDVRAFAAAHYKRGNAFVTAVGRLNDGVTAAARVLASALPAGSDEAVITKTRPFAATAKRIITQRDIGVTYVVLGFAAPAVGDKDFGTMLILRSLLSDVFDRQAATTLPAYARAVGVVYDYATKPASLALYINGGQLEPGAGVGGVDAVLKGIAEKAIDAKLLKRYKTSAHGEWETESVSLADRGWQIGNYVAQGVDPDYDEAALAAIDGVTSADVQRVAKAYLQKFTVALITPRDAQKPAN